MKNWDVEIANILNESAHENIAKVHLNSKWRIVEAGLETRRKTKWWFIGTAAAVLIICVNLLVFMQNKSAAVAGNKFKNLNNTPLPVAVKPAISGDTPLKINSDKKIQNKENDIIPKVAFLPTEIIENSNGTDTLIPEFGISVVEPPIVKTTKKKRKAGKSIYITQTKANMPTVNITKEEKLEYFDFGNNGRHANTQREEKNNIIKF